MDDIMSLLQNHLFPLLNALACFGSCLYIIKSGRVLGYWPAVYSISFLPMLYIGGCYAVFVVLQFSSATLSLLVRGPALLLFLAPGIDALVRLREAKSDGLDKR